MAAGAVLVIGGVVITVVTAGAGAPLAGLIIGGAVAGFGMGFGVTGALTNDFGAAVQAGAIGAVAGGLAGAASYGAMGLAAAGLGLGAASASTTALVNPLARLGAQVLMGGAGGAAGGFVGGFAGGTLGGLSAGQSWGEALESGCEAAVTGAIGGGVLGAAVPLVAVALRALWVGGNQVAAMGYLRATVGKDGWWQTFRSMRTWTPRLRFSLRGAKGFRMAVSEERIQGMFASIERPASLEEGMARNALLRSWYPGELPRELFRVTARPGFYVGGVIGPQGSGPTWVPGGNTQIVVPTNKAGENWTAAQYLETLP